MTSIHRNLQKGVVYINRFLTGLVTERSALFSPLTAMGLNVIDMYDALIDGLNSEISRKMTLIRRPAYQRYCSAVLGAEKPKAFYSFKNLDGTIYPIVDTDHNLYHFDTTTKTLIVAKNTTAQTYFRGVGDMLYFCDGTDSRKWNNVPQPAQSATLTTQAVPNQIRFTATTAGVGGNNVTITMAGVTNTADATAVTVSGNDVTIQIKKAGGTTRTLAEIIALMGTYPPTTTDGGVITCVDAQAASTATAATAIAQTSLAGGVAALTITKWGIEAPFEAPAIVTTEILQTGPLSPTSGYKWGYCFHNSNTGHVSTMSPPVATGPTGTTTYAETVTIPAANLADYTEPISIDTVKARFWNSLSNNGQYRAHGSTAPALTLTGNSLMFNTYPNTLLDGLTDTRTITEKPLRWYQTAADGSFAFYKTCGSFSNNFDVAATGNFYIPAAGDITFNFFSNDGYVFGIGGGATVVANNNFQPIAPVMTKTDQMGYTVMQAYNRNVDYTTTSSFSLTVHFPTTGVYGFELDYAQKDEGLCCSVVAGGVAIPQFAAPSTYTALNIAGWQTDAGVVFTPSGTALTQVGAGQATLSTGQYSVANGVYRFASADAGQDVIISYVAYGSMRYTLEFQVRCSDPQVDKIQIYRTDDGGSNYYLRDTIDNPGDGEIVDFVDMEGDDSLNDDIVAPIAHANDPPPAGARLATFHQGRMWVASGNFAYYGGGPDVTNGVPEEAFPPANYFKFPGEVTAMVSTSAGLIVWTADNLYVVTGSSLASFTSQLFQTNFGVNSQNCVAQDGDTVFVFTSRRQLFQIGSANIQEIGFNIRPQLALIDASSAYLALHRSGEDEGLFISDGATKVFRYSIAMGCWNPVAQPLMTAGAIGSVETTTAIWTLLLGANANASYVFSRDTTKSKDDGVAYAAWATIGSLQLAAPNQTATVESVSLQTSTVGTYPTLSVLLNEVSGSFTAVPNPVPEPPLLPASSSINAKRHYLKAAQTPLPQAVVHMQVKIDMATEDAANEILSLVIG